MPLPFRPIQNWGRRPIALSRRTFTQIPTGPNAQQCTEIALGD